MIESVETVMVKSDSNDDIALADIMRRRFKVGTAIDACVGESSKNPQPNRVSAAKPSIVSCLTLRHNSLLPHE